MKTFKQFLTEQIINEEKFVVMAGSTDADDRDYSDQLEDDQPEDDVFMIAPNPTDADLKVLKTFDQYDVTIKNGSAKAFAKSKKGVYYNSVHDMIRDMGYEDDEIEKMYK